MKTHVQWAVENIRRYQKCRNRLMSGDYNDASAVSLLLQCYKNLYGAEINYRDAKTPGVEFSEYGYIECERLRLNFATIIQQAMFEGVRYIDLPSMVTHALSAPSLPGQADGC